MAGLRPGTSPPPVRIAMVPFPMETRYGQAAIFSRNPAEVFDEEHQPPHRLAGRAPDSVHGRVRLPRRPLGSHQRAGDSGRHAALSVLRERSISGHMLGALTVMGLVPSLEGPERPSHSRGDPLAATSAWSRSSARWTARLRVARS